MSAVPIGRFAPTPSGNLHFGSLVTALASYLSIKQKNGLWRLRIDDIDPPRVVDGACDQIQSTLLALGLAWDGDVILQSNRYAAYQEMFDRLINEGKAYYCQCSRKAISKRTKRQFGANVVYDGHCKALGLDSGAIRYQSDLASLQFNDDVAGSLQFNPKKDFGDFIIRRSDGFWGYHLATVVDEHLDKVTEIVRGSDLIESSARQITLRQALKFSTTSFAHIPIALNNSHEKLSKQRLSPALNHSNGPDLLWYALQYLRQSPPDSLRSAACADIIQWGVENWSLKTLRKSGSQVVKFDSTGAPSGLLPTSANHNNTN